MAKSLAEGELGWRQPPAAMGEAPAGMTRISREGATPVVAFVHSPGMDAVGGTQAAGLGQPTTDQAAQPVRHFRQVQPSDEGSDMDRRRRHASLHQRLWHSWRVQRLVGLLVAVVLPAGFQWGWGVWQQATSAQWVALGGAIAACLVAIMAVQHLSQLPGTRAYRLVIPALSVCYGVLWGGLELLGVAHEGSHLLLSYATGAIVFSAAYLFTEPHRRLHFAVVPHGRAGELSRHTTAEWHVLESPSLEGLHVDGVVADLRCGLSEPWQRFLSDCTLHRIPVYHASSTLETLTGRVSLQDNRMGNLQPDEGYEILKRFLDVVGVLLLLPLLLPIMAVTAVAIRLETPGPVFFTQPRMGLHFRPFTVFKFRSMYIDRQGNGFTQDGHDPRITRVGRVIRKYRIDELPQVFNVLKGDMSLIGPRPESLDLSTWYRDDVPFFHYRHVVRPGISGWAQVEQGYAAEVDGMNRKLEYDFYYIKHFSFWLDVLIVIRTLRTIFTGFGSR
ncbi:exopolysaccharide biosynthesis polyprenyl glycosylphosphotransferase [Halomonas marinisediminis]|nr:exopolysaccharide biosynthesis polyprenyl glycosylphosphotransferase [Halomonas marinisediminis]